MFEITTTTSEPYAAIVYLRSVWSDGSATRASGVMVGENDLLTALHTVYDPTLGWAKSVTIIPGTDTSPYFTEPFGAFSNVGSMVGLAPTWDLNGDGLLTQQESSGDMALLGFTTRVGDATGWLPVASVATDFGGLMVGYPARGTGMMAESVYAQASLDWSVYDIDSGLGPGASGGPLLDNLNGVPTVVGVLSSGNVADTASTYAALDDPATMAWLQQAMAANDSLLGMAPGTAAAPSPTVVMGTSAADVLAGTAGRDVFTGLAGNDTIDGGAGIDTANYSGTRASYTITQLPSGALQVADSNPARDGTDTLTNVERLHFSDEWIAFDLNGDAGQAYRLYLAALDRAPDPAGLGYHINRLDDGLSLATVAEGFIASPEFQQKYGNVDDTKFITLLYENVLHREPEQAGLDYHLAELASGQTRAMVLTHFSESPECQALVIGTIQNGIAYTA